MTECADAPEPKVILRVSLQDVIDRAEWLGVDITRTQALSVFRGLDCWDGSIMDSFHEELDHAIGRRDLD